MSLTTHLSSGRAKMRTAPGSLTLTLSGKVSVRQFQLLLAEDFPGMLTMFWYVQWLSPYENLQPVSYFPCFRGASQAHSSLLGQWLARVATPWNEQTIKDVSNSDSWFEMKNERLL